MKNAPSKWEYGFPLANKTQTVSHKVEARSFPRARVAFGLFGVGCVLSFLTFFFAIGMTGAGHGIYSPVEIAMGPCNIWGFFLWPIFAASANSSFFIVRAITKTIVIFYYGWLLHFLIVDSNILNDYERVTVIRSVFWLWTIAFGSLHGLIWLTFPLLKVLKSDKK